MNFPNLCRQKISTRAADKYNLTEQQILDSIANNEQLTIEGGIHVLRNELGRSTTIRLAGRTVTFSWKYKVSEEDKIKLLAMKNRETYHMIARQYCEYMNKEGMFASENVIDDNGGLIKHGFEFEKHGGLFAPSLTVLRTNTPLMAKHFTNCTTPILKTLLKTFMLSL